MRGTAIRMLLVAGLVLLSSPTGGLRADEPSATPASPAAPAPKPVTTGPRDENVLAEFEVAKDGDYLLLPVTIQGKTYSFVVDTGATRSVFGIQLKSLMGPSRGSIKARTSGGSANFEVFEVPDAAVGAFVLPKKTPVPCVDMHWISDATGTPIVGMLGMDFLVQHIIGIDFDVGKMRFLKSLPENPGTRISMLYGPSLHPFVVAEVEGIGPETVVIDTGSNGTLAIRDRHFERLLRKGQLIPRRAGFASTLGGEIAPPSGLLSSFCLNEFKHHQLLVQSGDATNAGLAYLSRYHIIFDFPKQAMYLTPGRRFKEPDRDGQSGITLERKNGKTVIRTVCENSPASDVGLQANDIIILVDGMPVDRLTMFALRRKLMTPHGQITMQVSRSDELVDVTLILRDYRSELQMQ